MSGSETSQWYGGCTRLWWGMVHSQERFFVKECNLAKVKGRATPTFYVLALPHVEAGALPSSLNFMLVVGLPMSENEDTCILSVALLDCVFKSMHCEAVTWFLTSATFRENTACMPRQCLGCLLFLWQ